MTITPTDIAWGSYKEFEGPFGRGSKPFALPATPSENHKYLAVLTATEGGRFDAINMYDRCIVSIGLVQWCEASYFLSSKLLGAIAEKDLGLMAPLQPALSASGAIFTKTQRGAWRFLFKDSRGECDTAAEQQQLFLLRSNGLKGSWDAESKEHAKLWAACLANTLAQDAALPIQVDYTAARVKGFAMPASKAVLLDDPAASEGWVGAMRAGFLSYAGNLPAVAAKHLDIALKTAPGAKWSKDWCIHIFKELTFGPQIAIYPHRYNAIRPVLEKLYGVDMPDFAKELATWKAEMTKEAPAGEDEPDFMDLKEVQAFLIGVGYDLGPAGADGRMGTKTKDAIRTFQGLNGLTADGILGPKTRAKLLEVWRQVGSLS